ncbi:MAG: amidohydrolase family protein [Bacteroidota bacterium]
MAHTPTIIENGFVVTCDENRTAGRFALLSKDERIADMAPRADMLKARAPEAEVIDASEKVILPGFVDPHVHGESFLLREWTASVPMVKWQRDPAIRRVLAHVYHSATREDLLVMYRASYFSALKSGVTCLAEFGFDNLDVPLLAAAEAFKRTDLKGWIGLHNGDQVEQARSMTAGSLKFGLILPSEEELTTYNLQNTLRAAQELEWPLISHLGQTKKGVESVRKNFLRSITQILDEYRIFQFPLHLTHLAFVDRLDAEILRKASLPVILGPGAILEKGTEIPPLEILLGQGIPIALCTDWGASDPFSTMRALLRIAQVKGIDDISPFDLLAMHTRTAARALGIHHETGSIQIGKKADLCLVDVSDVRQHRMLDTARRESALSNFLQEASAGDVTDVMINGEFFIRRGEIMTYAEEDLKREITHLKERLTALTPSTAPLGDPDHLPTPVISLTPTVVREPEHAPVEPDVPDGDFEEGFRIVSGTSRSPQTGNDSPASTPHTGQPVELPKTVKRVFGDDDVSS